MKLTTEEKKQSILDAHTLTGHNCVNNNYSFIKKHLINLIITRDEVKSVILGCKTCSKFRRNPKFKQYPTKIDGTFLQIGIDWIGPLPKSSYGDRFIVLATDYFSK